MNTVTEIFGSLAIIPIVIACFVGVLVVGCGSENSSGGVAQLDDSNLIFATETNPKGTTQLETSGTPLLESTSSSEDISEQTDEEIATSFAECLRTEGINVPDPELNADGTVNMAALRQNLAGNPGFNFQDPRFRQTMDKCVPILQNASFAGQPSREDEIELQDNLLEFAECLRGIGVDVGDPDFSEGRGGAFRSMIGDLDIDRDSLQVAMSQCSETIFGNERNEGPGRPGPGRPRPPGR